MSKRIAARHLHPTDFDHEHARGDFSGHEQRLILAVALQLAEAEEPVDFRTGEFWKHAFVARIESRHGPSSRVQHNPIRKVSRVSATACGSGQGRINLPNCNFGLSLRSRMELVYQGKEVGKGPIVLKKSEYLLERYNIPRPLCAITNPLTKNAHAVYGLRYSSDELNNPHGTAAELKRIIKEITKWCGGDPGYLGFVIRAPAYRRACPWQKDRAFPPSGCARSP